MASIKDPRETTGSLIAASQVSGTGVYGPAAERLGQVDDIIIDKASGRIAYAVLSIGGFLGLGGEYHPLPWAALHYDRELGGYVVNVERSSLESAPHYADATSVSWEDRAWGQRVHDHYHTPPYWDALA